MQAQELLSVLPADLIKSILARRQTMAGRLPKELEQRQEENDRAFQLAKVSREELQALQNTTETATSNAEELLKAQQLYDEHEQFRRRTSSRLQTIKNNIKDCQEAIEFWEGLADGNWGHLLEDAERVRGGGASSYAEAKRHATEGSS
jgi:vacuolar-type H+-ATPase subunit I/STV1